MKLFPPPDQPTPEQQTNLLFQVCTTLCNEMTDLPGKIDSLNKAVSNVAERRHLLPYVGRDFLRSVRMSNDFSETQVLEYEGRIESLMAQAALPCAEPDPAQEPVRSHPRRTARKKAGAFGSAQDATKGTRKEVSGTVKRVNQPN